MSDILYQSLLFGHIPNYRTWVIIEYFYKYRDLTFVVPQFIRQTEQATQSCHEYIKELYLA